MSSWESALMSRACCPAYGNACACLRWLSSARAEWWADIATAIMMRRYGIVFSFVPGDLKRPAEIVT